MSNLIEIIDTINFIAKSQVYKISSNTVKILNKKKHQYIKKKIYILHCVTDYPVEDKFANLNCIKTLKDSLRLKIGYSDHTLGFVAPIIAVTLGAEIIEKHITLDKKMNGPDHKASLDCKEFKNMCNYIRKYELMAGNGIKKIQKCEKKNFIVARKSIVARNDINKGDLFSLKNLAVKRPAGGLSPTKYFKLIGKKSSKNYRKDELIRLK
jgi:N,N'-diacetyllegionaminate synthase